MPYTICIYMPLQIGRFVGDDSNNECGIEIKNVTKAEAGVWICELEEHWVGRHRGYGQKVNF